MIDTRSSNHIYLRWAYQIHHPPALTISHRVIGLLPSPLHCGARSLGTNGRIMTRTTLLMEKGTTTAKMCTRRLTTTTNTRIRSSRSLMKSKRRVGWTSVMNASTSSRSGFCLRFLLASHIIPDGWWHSSRRRSPRWGILCLASTRGTQKIRRRGEIMTSSFALPYLS